MESRYGKSRAVCVCLNQAEDKYVCLGMCVFCSRYFCIGRQRKVVMADQKTIKAAMHLTCFQCEKYFHKGKLMNTSILHVTITHAHVSPLQCCLCPTVEYFLCRKYKICKTTFIEISEFSPFRIFSRFTYLKHFLSVCLPKRNFLQWWAFIWLSWRIITFS